MSSRRSGRLVHSPKYRLGCPAPQESRGAVVTRMERTADLRAATDLIVIAGTGYNPRRRQENRVVHRERGTDVITRLADVLTNLGDQERHWMEWPELSLVFLRDGLVLAEYGVLRGGSWVGDRAVAQSGGLGAWLDVVRASLSGET
jgi:hypothetical protein